MAISVEDVLVEPQLVARIATALGASSRVQSFEDESAVGVGDYRVSFTPVVASLGSALPAEPL